MQIDILTERKILELNEQGVPTSIIRKSVGCCRKTVFNVRKRNKVRSKLKPGSNRGVYKTPPDLDIADIYLKMHGTLNSVQKPVQISAEITSSVAQKENPIEELEDFSDIADVWVERSRTNINRNKIVFDMI